MGDMINSSEGLGADKLPVGMRFMKTAAVSKSACFMVCARCGNQQ